MQIGIRFFNSRNYCNSKVYASFFCLNYSILFVLILSTSNWGLSHSHAVVHPKTLLSYPLSGTESVATAVYCAVLITSFFPPPKRSAIYTLFMKKQSTYTGLCPLAIDAEDPPSKGSLSLACLCGQNVNIRRTCAVSNDLPIIQYFIYRLHLQL